MVRDEQGIRICLPGNFEGIWGLFPGNFEGFCINFKNGNFDSLEKEILTV
jgi:hypothetical protein